MHINTSAPTLRNEPQSDAGANAAAWYCVRAQPQTVRHTLVVVWKETVPAGCQGVAAARSVLAGTERIVFAVAVLLAVAVAIAVSILPVAIGSIVDSGSDHVAWVASLETLAACSTCGTDGAAAASALDTARSQLGSAEAEEMVRFVLLFTGTALVFAVTRGAFTGVAECWVRRVHERALMLTLRHLQRAGTSDVPVEPADARRDSNASEESLYHDAHIPRRASVPGSVASDADESDGEVHVYRDGRGKPASDSTAVVDIAPWEQLDLGQRAGAYSAPRPRIGSVSTALSGGLAARDDPAPWQRWPQPRDDGRAVAATEWVHHADAIRQAIATQLLPAIVVLSVVLIAPIAALAQSAELAALALAFGLLLQALLAVVRHKLTESQVARVSRALACWCHCRVVWLTRFAGCSSKPRKSVRSSCSSSLRPQIHRHTGWVARWPLRGCTTRIAVGRRRCKPP